MSEWQPIETAPSHGKKIIVYYPNRGVEPRAADGDWWRSFPKESPTHWMPLPEAPK